MTSEQMIEARHDEAARLRDAGAKVESLVSAELPLALRRLAQLKITSVLLEGGATVHRAAWEGGVVDKVQIYVAPMRLGPDRVPWLGDQLDVSLLADVHVGSVGCDILIEGYVQRLD